MAAAEPPTLSPDMSFHTQSPIPPDLGHLYIQRPCDQEVEDLLARREYIAVIGPRLSGKSSLLIHQWARLSTPNGRIVPVYISLKALHAPTPADWFTNIHREIVRQTNGLMTPPSVYATHALALQEDITESLEKELRGYTLIIMLDQVENTPDDVAIDFFSMVREMYVTRWQRPALHSLSFVLAGRFLPDELITNSENSPFRITVTVFVKDAELDAIRPLVGYLENTARTLAPDVADHIYNWAEGDVYLTHKLCAAMARDIPHGVITHEDVERAVHRHLYQDSIFRCMWRTIETNTAVYDLINTLLDHSDQIRFNLLDRAVMVAWLEGAIKEDVTSHCALHSTVHERVLHSMRTIVLNQQNQRTRGVSPSDDHELLHERFRVENTIYHGMTAYVRRGTDVHSNQPVAIKQLSVARDRNETAWRRFQLESEVLRRLDHPNIVKLIDAFSEGNFEYIVMEYVHGGSLYDRLNQGRLSLRQALEITGAVADALQHAHDHGVVHRDVKPSNIMLTHDLTPKLADFGVARLRHHISITPQMQVIGTTQYLSPEACKGQALDARTDIWSLGVTLFEMVTGTRPFVGASDHMITHAILEGDMPDMLTRGPHVPLPVIDLVNRMLTRPVQFRIPSCANVCEAIGRILPTL